MISASLAVWLVIGMGLFRDRSIAEVVFHLGLVLTTGKKEEKRPLRSQHIAPSAIPQRRQALGEDPLKHLFAKSAQLMGGEGEELNRWKGLQLYGLDGTSFWLPDWRIGRPLGSQPAGGEKLDIRKPAL